MKLFFVKSIMGKFATPGNYVGGSAPNGYPTVDRAKQFKSYAAADKWIVSNASKAHRPGGTGTPWVYYVASRTEYEIVEVDFTPVVVKSTPRVVTFGSSQQGPFTYAEVY